MKCSIPEISWHNRDPVLSVDVQIGNFKNSAQESYWRIVTAGADSHVLVMNYFILIPISNILDTLMKRKIIFYINEFFEQFNNYNFFAKLLFFFWFDS